MVIERFAKGSARVGGTGIGSTIGAFFNSPAVFGLSIIGILLIFFSGDIRKAFGSFGESITSAIPSFELPDISLPDITFPSFDIDFPEISLPDIDFPDVLGGAGAAVNAAGDSVSGFFEGIAGFFENQPREPLTEEDQFDFSSLEGGVSPEPSGEPAPPFRDAERFAKDFPETFVESPPFEPTFSLPVELPEAFVGGGVSFEGGTIFETPIENLSLSQIIDKFNVSASKAADILARAKDDFDDFDFGTNTGSGIFGTPTGQENIITGGATLESEEQRAACVSCELFGLNCPICAGTI